MEQGGWKGTEGHIGEKGKIIMPKTEIIRGGKF